MPSDSMDQQTMIGILSGRRRGAGPGALRAFLGAAALPYAVAMRIRRWAYRRRILPARSVAAPVICVGNLTTGGTGKTPMTAWVVDHLRRLGRQPAVLTRGYQRGPGKSDEARLLERACGVPVVINPDRVAGAKAAIAAGADVLVMDDGFQHRRIRRDLDIVLIDATNPFGFGWCLPRGLLREPVSALRGADALVVTRSDAVAPEALPPLRDRLARLAPEAVLCSAIHAPVALLDEANRAEPPDAVSGRRVCAFCGIGNPAHFFQVLEALGGRVLATRALDDHVTYTKALLRSLRELGARCGAEIFITTQKDFVKLSDADLGLPVRQLEVRMEIVQGKDRLWRQIEAAAGSQRRREQSG